MHVVRTIADWRAIRETIREKSRENVPEETRRYARERIAENSRRVGFVPTMGALHAGHVSLVERARAECDVVVVSIFVNPTQFNNAADLSVYPRTERADIEQLRAAGTDCVFAPTAEEMYPSGSITHIDVGRIAEPLEGEARGVVHFRGVATIVAKLLNIVQPDVAYFGQKDAQQLLVVKQLVRDLNMPVDIVGCETMREADGLALSSRNVRLDAKARAQAVGLSTALRAMRDLVANGEGQSAHVLAAGFSTLARFDIAASAIDYLAVVAQDSLQPMETIAGDILIAVAAHVDGVRLIDNVTVHVPMAQDADGST